ncbi:O-antigen ligase family protein [Salinibacter altiplanensis]|uniref:O-antigen ligase family protein n=1 Tax=Salinibacter altiplanensis TaxID=1803181 RepID=UPI000C9F88CC|nr:O-antigen ligase family protein [Salinibacter altiplanensis]
MRYWHLLFGTIFIYLAAHIKLGVPAEVASLGRWGALFGVAGVSIWLLTFSDRSRALPAQTGGVGMAVLTLYVFLFGTVLAGFQVRLSLLKWILMGTHLIVFVYAAHRLLSLREWSWLVWGLFFLWAGVAIIIFVAAVTGVAPILSQFGIYYQGRLAVLGNPNSVGMVVLACSITALSLQEWPAVIGRWRRRIILLGTLVVSFFVLLWTGSRSSLGGFVVGGLMWAVATGKSGKVIGFGLLGGVVLWVWTLDLSSLQSLGVIVERLQSGTLLATREGVWEASLRNWQEYPWFGHGYGVTDRGYDLEGLAGSVGSVRDGSGYFGVLESVGIVGLSLYFVLYGVVARNLWRLTMQRELMKGRPGWRLALYGGVLFLGFAVNAAGEPWLLGPGSFPHIVFWWALGVHVAGMVRCEVGTRHRHTLARQGVRATAGPGTTRGQR